MRHFSPGVLGKPTTIWLYRPRWAPAAAEHLVSEGHKVGIRLATGDVEAIVARHATCHGAATLAPPARPRCCGLALKAEGQRPGAPPSQDNAPRPARTTGRRPEGTDHLPRRNQGWRYCAWETRRRTPAIIRGGPPRVSSRAAGEGSRPSYRAA